MANLGVIDADPSEPPSDDEVIKLANRLLSEFNIPTKIEEVGDVCAALFVLLYENLFSDRLSDIIRHPVSKEDEIHNCQTVIDVLSSDIVRDSLSHIRGVDIVNGDITAMSNLLDIFSYLLDYVANRIESDIATDNEDAKSLTNADQESDASSNITGTKSNRHYITAHSRDNRSASSRSDYKKSKSYLGLNEKNGRKSPANDRKSPANDTNENCCANKYSATSRPRVKSPSYLDGDSLALPPSPIRADQSQSLLGQKTVDSTELDLQFGKDDRESPVPKFDGRQELKTDDLDTAIGGVVSSTTTTTAFPPPATDSSAAAAAATLSDFDTYPKPRDDKVSYFSASLPPPKLSREEEKDIPIRSTVGPIDYSSLPHTQRKVHSDRTSDRDLVKGLSSSYNDLRSLVEKTAAMTRVAIQTSPIMGRAQRELNLGDDADRPRPTIPGDSARLARELNAKEMRRKESSRPDLVSHDLPSRSTKKVAFSSYADAHSPRSPGRRHPLEELNDNFSRSNRNHVYGDEMESLRYGGYDHSGDDYRSRPKSSPVKHKQQKKGPSKTEAFAKHLARSRQPELGAAHMNLKTEDRLIKKKQDFLQRMYQEDLGELSEDVWSILNKDHKVSQDKEKEMLKFYMESSPVIKATQKTKSSSSKKPRTVNRVVSSKAKRESTGQRKPSSTTSLKAEEEENLLSFLIEEFPHLQLSDHTWHELCRKNLHQIETITRVYKENQRKKSRAQTQVEEAAKRHELLSDIMKKEVDHTKRLREMKETKVQQTHLKNKTHERRAQSARARRYYNEYQVRARGKQLKRSTREEMVFKDLFRDAMKIQKERIKDIRQYTSDQRKSQEIRRQNEMDSMENFYQGQFQMLAEKLAQERKETSLRDRAQHQMVERIKRELRKKIESEICLYQEQMFRDDDDAHFRQMDADRVKRELHMARYAAQI